MAGTTGLRAAHAAAERSPGAFASGIRGWSKAGPLAFPFSGLRAMTRSFRWPASFEYSNEWPRDVTAPRGPSASWSDNSQGIARDNDYWYLVIEDALWYFGTGPRKPLPPDQEATVVQGDLVLRGRRQLVDVDHGRPKHLGAPARVGNLLLVPAEGERVPGDSGLWVWVFDTTTLGYVGRIFVPQTTSFPWCAVTPDGRLLYTSAFGDLVDIVEIRVFQLPSLRGFGPPSPGMAIDSISAASDRYALEVGRLPLHDVDGSRIALGNVQGGCVSPNWHLYLSFERVRKDDGTYDSAPPGSVNGHFFAQTVKGVLGVDLLTGNGVHFVSSDRGDEVEGVLADMDRVHVLHNDDDWPSSDEFTISHYGANPPGSDLV